MDPCGRETIVKLVFHASNLVSMGTANIEGVSVTNTGQVTVVTLKCLAIAVFVKMEELVDWVNASVQPAILGTGVESQLKICRSLLQVIN